MNWDAAFRRELKRFKAETARALAKKRSARAPMLEGEPKPRTWDEALQGVLIRFRRKVARMRKSGVPAAAVPNTPPE